MSARGDDHVELLHPSTWRDTSGYANGAAASGRVIVTTQVGWNADQHFEHSDLAGQVRRALENIVTVLAEADARPDDLIKLTWFVRDVQSYKRSLKDIGQAYRDTIGRHYPAMAMFEVGLVDDEALVEIDAMAVQSLS